MTTKPRRVSAAAARRLRTEISTPPPAAALPAELEALLLEFGPGAPLNASWPRLRPVVAETLGRSRIRGTDSFRKYLTHLGYFLMWAEAQELPLAVATVVRAHTDEYTRTGMTASSEKSRADRRSRLRYLADQVNPHQAPDKGVTISRPVVKAPYTATEVAQILRVTATQPTPRQVRIAAVCVGLGLGAGLDSADFRGLRGEHIVDDPAGGLLVARARTDRSQRAGSARVRGPGADWDA